MMSWFAEHHCFGGLDRVSDFNSYVSLTSQSARETKAASHVLQTVWSYKDLRNALTKDGWNKSHFQVHRYDLVNCPLCAI